MFRRHAILVITAALLHASAAGAATPPEKGDRVRVRTDSVGIHEARIEGRWVGTDDGDLVLFRRGAPVRGPRSSVLDLEVSRGERRYWKEGAFVGTLTGLLVGAAGAIYLCGQDDDGCGLTPVSFLLGTFGAAGGAAGLMVGLGLSGPDWQAVPLDDVVRAPEPGRELRAGISTSW